MFRAAGRWLVIAALTLTAGLGARASDPIDS